MKTKSQEKKYLFYDISLIAFLAIYLKENPLPIVTEEGRVAFSFAKDVSTAIALWYGDHPIPCFTFTQKVKEIRRTMFALRGGK
jgi:bacteriorhodopsin